MLADKGKAHTYWIKKYYQIMVDCIQPDVFILVVNTVKQYHHSTNKDQRCCCCEKRDLFLVFNSKNWQLKIPCTTVLVWKKCKILVNSYTTWYCSKCIYQNLDLSNSTNTIFVYPKSSNVTRIKLLYWVTQGYSLILQLLAIFWLTGMQSVTDFFLNKSLRSNSL